MAAVFVLIYHLCETHFGLGAAHPLNHGYLAVDFFFALSGFVIGYAYDLFANLMQFAAKYAKSRRACIAITQKSMKKFG